MAKVIDQDTGETFPLDRTTVEYANDIRAWHAAYTCEHLETGLRRKRNRNGQFAYGHQCLRCGQYPKGWVPKSSIPPEVADGDPTLPDRFDAERETRRQDIDQKHVRLQREEGNNFAKRHREYLASPAWKAKRDKVLKRARGRCEGCGEADATEVHHLTYIRHGREMLFDLVAVCRGCHEVCHPETSVPPPTDDDLPCYACRLVEFRDKGEIWCGRFQVPTGEALGEKGPCGPTAAKLDPLR